jgi:hypothetical protein
VWVGGLLHKAHERTESTARLPLRRAGPAEARSVPLGHYRWSLRATRKRGREREPTQIGGGRASLRAPAPFPPPPPPPRSLAHPGGRGIPTLLVPMRAVARAASLLRRAAAGPAPAAPHHSLPGARPSLAKVRTAPLLSSLSPPFPLSCPRCGGAPLPGYRCCCCCCYPRRQRISSLRVGAASVGFTSGLGARVVQLLRRCSEFRMLGWSRPGCEMDLLVLG